MPSVLKGFPKRKQEGFNGLYTHQQNYCIFMQLQRCDHSYFPLLFTLIAKIYIKSCLVFIPTLVCTAEHCTQKHNSLFRCAQQSTKVGMCSEIVEGVVHPKNCHLSSVFVCTVKVKTTLDHNDFQTHMHTLRFFLSFFVFHRGKSYRFRTPRVNDDRI